MAGINRPYEAEVEDFRVGTRHRWEGRGPKNPALQALGALKVGEAFVIACRDHLEKVRVPTLALSAARRRGFEVSTTRCRDGVIVERLPPVRI